MKILVVYKSQTGFTKMYGDWIAEKLNCDATPLKGINKKALKNYDLIIFGGGVHAGSINGLNQIKKLWREQAGKKLVVYCTGATPVEDIEVIKEIENKNISQTEVRDTPFFYFQSGLNYEKMNIGGKLLMKMFLGMLEKKSDKTEQEKDMLNMIKQSCDFSDKKYIDALVSFVNGMEDE